jgi:hypothetical protein
MAIVAATALLTIGVLAGPAVGYPPGRRFDAADLRVLGVSVDWPFAGASVSVAPGSRFVVRVHVLKNHAPRVRLTFLRVSPSGASRAPISRKTLWYGTFVVHVPRVDGGHYALAMTVAHHKYLTWVDTPQTSPVTLPPSSPPVGFVDPCAAQDTTFSATMSLATTSLPAGDSVRYTIANTGTGCLEAGAGYVWQHFVNGTWQTVPNKAPFPAVGIRIVPATSWSNAATADASLAPGHYRLSTGLYPLPIPPGTTSPSVTVSAELEVTPNG